MLLFGQIKRRKLPTELASLGPKMNMFKTNQQGEPQRATERCPGMSQSFSFRWQTHLQRDRRPGRRPGGRPGGRPLATLSFLISKSIVSSSVSSCLFFHGRCSSFRLQASFPTTELDPVWVERLWSKIFRQETIPEPLLKCHVSFHKKGASIQGSQISIFFELIQPHLLWQDLSPVTFK